MPLTTPRIDIPKTMIVNDPKRSGKCCTCGVKCKVVFLVNIKGVPTSIVNPIIHKINLI